MATDVNQKKMDQIKASIRRKTKEAYEKACEAYKQPQYCGSGLVIIFNQVTTDKSSISKDLLKETFEGINFKVKDFYDLKKKKALDIISEAKASEELKEYDCFVCVVLAHGRTNETNGEQQLLFKDGLVDLKELSEPVSNDNCKTLAGKPKIFIIEACRGSLRDEKDVDYPLPTGAFIEGEEEEDLDKSALGPFPVFQNFLYAFGTYKGYVCYGSWFIGALTECINLHHKEETLLQILTRAIGVVAQRICTKEANDKKDKIYGDRLQTANFTSSLTSDIKFGQKPQLEISGVQSHPSGDEHDEPQPAGSRLVTQPEGAKQDIFDPDLIEEFSNIIQGLPKKKDDWNVRQVKDVLKSVEYLKLSARLNKNQ